MSDKASTEAEDHQPLSQEAGMPTCDTADNTRSIPEFPWQLVQKTYGNNYKDHLLEQYKLFVEMADRISQRRAQTNAFYISILAGIVGILTFLGDKMPLTDIPSGILLLVGFLGVILCISWGVNIHTHKQLSSGKFKVIHEMEKNLPYPCYDREWELLKQGTDIRRYCKLTNSELFVPIFLSIPFVGLFLKGLWHCEWVTFLLSQM